MSTDWTGYGLVSLCTVDSNGSATVRTWGLSLEALARVEEQLGRPADREEIMTAAEVEAANDFTSRLEAPRLNRYPEGDGNG